MALRLVTLSGIGEYADLAVPGWFDVLLNVLGAGLLLVAVRLLFRSPRGLVRLEPEDEERLRALLARHGERDSLGYLALRRDRAVCWSPSGKAAVLHRVVNGVTFATGDPIGDPEAWPQAIEVWRQQARQYAWIPAVLGAGSWPGWRTGGPVCGRWSSATRRWWRWRASCRPRSCGGPGAGHRGRVPGAAAAGTGMSRRPNRPSWSGWPTPGGTAGASAG